jgi:uncharacterized protein YndB with AHSA1/START domain
MTAKGKHDTGITTPSDREIRRERVFDAPRERVWEACTKPELIAQWWGRGNKLVIEKCEVERGGHWRYVEHTPHGVFGFEGRYREVKEPERLVRSFEWDGMPAHVAIETIEFIDLGDGTTKIISTLLLHTTPERDGMMNAGMEAGMNAAYAKLDELLAK